MKSRQLWTEHDAPVEYSIVSFVIILLCIRQHVFNIWNKEVKRMADKTLRKKNSQKIKSMQNNSENEGGTTNKMKKKKKIVQLLACGDHGFSFALIWSLFYYFLLWFMVHFQNELQSHGSHSSYRPFDWAAMQCSIFGFILVFVFFFCHTIHLIAFNFAFNLKQFTLFAHQMRDSDNQR